MDKQKFIFPIRAIAWRMYQAESPIWYIPTVCRSLHFVTGNPDDKGTQCPMYSDENPHCFHVNEEGKTIFHTLSKDGRAEKRAIERYNKYRTDLYFIATKAGFQMQAGGMAVYFHFPTPIRWNKKKKEEMHGQMKGSKSDALNLLAGFEDALTGCDEIIGQYAGFGKFWFRPELAQPELREGFIEVLTGQPLHNPYGVQLSNPYKTVAMEDIESRRAKNKARKLELKKQREEEARKEAKKKKRKVKPIKLDEKKLFKKEDRIK